VIRAAFRPCGERLLAFLHPKVFQGIAWQGLRRGRWRGSCRWRGQPDAIWPPDTWGTRWRVPTYTSGRPAKALGDALMSTEPERDADVLRRHEADFVSRRQAEAAEPPAFVYVPLFSRALARRRGDAASQPGPHSVMAPASGLDHSPFWGQLGVRDQLPSALIVTIPGPFGSGMRPLYAPISLMRPS